MPDVKYYASGTGTSTGEFTIAEETGVAPGATVARLEVVPGTDSGTAALIMYAGTSTTPVTIVDNVGAGVV